MCSVTSETSQNNKRQSSSFQESLALLTSERWTLKKISPSNRHYAVCDENWKYISEHNQDTETMKTDLSQWTQMCLTPTLYDITLEVRIVFPVNEQEKKLTKK